MHSTVRYMLALVGLMEGLTACAEETPLDIKSDLDGDYFIVEKRGTVNNPVLVVKRVSTDFAYYIKRKFDCEARTVRYLGEGDSLKAMAESEPEAEMSAITEGSVSDQLAKLVCPKKGEPAEK